ncbi:MAG: response regulator, partial [Cyanobacteria bacterium J06555_12]
MKILLVEDDDRIAGALAEDLSDSHYAVDIAEDGQAAWDLSEAYDYDLILLDVMLPRIDGITLCKRLRKTGCKTPIL